MTTHTAAPTHERGAHLNELERIRTGEILSPVARAERRLLLVVSMFGIAVVHTGLVPTKISALGVDFGSADRRALLLILTVIVVYFVSTFAIYAVVDFLAWRGAHDDALLMHLMHEHAFVPLREEPDDKPWERLQKQIRHRRWRWGTWSRKMSHVRAAWEFVLPVLVGAYGTVALLWARYHIK